MQNEPWPKGPWAQVGDPNGLDDIEISTLDRTERSVVPIALVSVGYEGPVEIEQRAAARLIAAAPDLYEALSALAAWEAGTQVTNEKLERIAKGMPLLPTEGYSGLTNESARRILRARAALARARGDNLDTAPASGDIGERSNTDAALRPPESTEGPIPVFRPSVREDGK